MVEHWQLFIDESGDFEGGDCDVVGGLLIRAPDTSILVRRLRLILDTAYPGLPYPPHAMELNLRAAPLACSILARRNGVSLGRELDELADRARSEWVSRSRSFFESADSGKMPGRSAMKAMGPWLSRQGRADFLVLQRGRSRQE